MLHGGIIATLMDDVMTLNRDPSAVMAYMNVGYLMPIYCVCCCEKEGGKWEGEKEEGVCGCGGEEWEGECVG
jgi:hypothetical protein